MDEKDIFRMFDYDEGSGSTPDSTSSGCGEYIPAVHSLNTEHIGRFIKESFGEDNPHVFNELMSKAVHLDIFCVQPSTEHRYSVLLTSGMSDLPMKTDDAENSRAELMMLLPESWNINNTASILWNWPMQYLKEAARHPHINGTALNCGDVLQFTATAEPFAENTGFCAFIFVRPSEERLRFIYGSGGMKVNVYVAVPVYKEELRFKLENGTEALIEKIYGRDELTLGDYVVDINRKNSCV